MLLWYGFHNLDRWWLFLQITLLTVLLVPGKWTVYNFHPWSIWFGHTPWEKKTHKSVKLSEAILNVIILIQLAHVDEWFCIMAAITEKWIFCTKRSWVTLKIVDFHWNITSLLQENRVFQRYKDNLFIICNFRLCTLENPRLI